MSDEKNTLLLTALLSVLPIALVLGIDFTAMSNQTAFNKAVSHFAFAVLISQILNQIVFIYGAVCPGPRARLSAVNLCWAGFWGAWLILNLTSGNHYVPTDFVCLSGIVLTFLTFRQPKRAAVRKAVLMIGLISGVIGLTVYLAILFALPSSGILSYNLVSQVFTGIILSYLALVISRNRLQTFIALLPFGFLAVLLLNAIAVLILVAKTYFGEAGELQASIAVYFVLHLILMAIFISPVLTETKLSYTPLIFALCVSLGLPFFI